MLASSAEHVQGPGPPQQVLFTLLIIGVYLWARTSSCPVSILPRSRRSAPPRSPAACSASSTCSRWCARPDRNLRLGSCPTSRPRSSSSYFRRYPEFEQWREQGAVGQRKLPRHPLPHRRAAVMQSSACVLFHSGELFARAAISPHQDFTLPGCCSSFSVHRRHGRCDVARRASSPSAASATGCRS